MLFNYFFSSINDLVVLSATLLILIACILLTLRLRFVQVRAIPYMLSLFVKNVFQKSDKKRSFESIQASKALFTAMSTSIGIGNIVAPVIAIELGGPGALIGFVLTSFFGAAVTFTEVTLALKHRKVRPDKRVMGGPMQYLNDGISPFWGSFYAYSGLILLILWCTNQSNTLADLLVPYHVPTYFTASVTSLLVAAILFGGIRRISEFAAKVVPVMFILYSAAALWILGLYVKHLPEVMHLIYTSLFSKQAALGTVGGVPWVMALRWGLAKGFQSNESGIGTASIPHSMSASRKPVDQGILSMVAVYSNGFLCILTGLVVLVTGVWKDHQAGIGINIVLKAFSHHIPVFGTVVLVLCSILFVLTTILGNAYNGSQCFAHVTGYRGLKLYYVLIAFSVFVGAILDVEFVWTYVDLFVIPVAFPHVIGLLCIVYGERLGLQAWREGK